MEKGFPAIALVMKSFPEYCIEDKQTYNELLRRIKAAHEINVYQKYTQHAFGRRGESATIGSTVDNIYDGLQALNYANAQLEARTCFRKRFWEV